MKVIQLLPCIQPYLISISFPFLRVFGRLKVLVSTYIGTIFRYNNPPFLREALSHYTESVLTSDDRYPPFYFPHTPSFSNVFLCCSYLISGSTGNSISLFCNQPSLISSLTSDGNLYVWQVYGGSEGEHCAQLKVHSYPVTALCLSDDGTQHCFLFYKLLKLTTRLVFRYYSNIG